jgi:hypothetical protein
MPSAFAQRSIFFYHQSIGLFFCLGDTVFKSSSGGIRPDVWPRSCWFNKRILFNGRQVGTYYIWLMQYISPLKSDY